MPHHHNDDPSIVEVSVQVEQGPETATPWAPVALVGVHPHDFELPHDLGTVTCAGRVLWNVLEWPSHTVTITLKVPEPLTLPRHTFPLHRHL